MTVRYLVRHGALDLLVCVLHGVWCRSNGGEGVLLGGEAAGTGAGLGNRW